MTPSWTRFFQFIWFLSSSKSALMGRLEAKLGASSETLDIIRQEMERDYYSAEMRLVDPLLTRCERASTLRCPPGGGRVFLRVFCWMMLSFSFSRLFPAPCPIPFHSIPSHPIPSFQSHPGTQDSRTQRVRVNLQCAGHSPRTADTRDSGKVQNQVSSRCPGCWALTDFCFCCYRPA